MRPRLKHFQAKWIRFTVENASNGKTKADSMSMETALDWACNKYKKGRIPRPSLQFFWRAASPAEARSSEDRADAGRSAPPAASRGDDYAALGLSAIANNDRPAMVPHHDDRVTVIPDDDGRTMVPHDDDRIAVIPHDDGRAVVPHHDDRVTVIPHDDRRAVVADDDDGVTMIPHDDGRAVVADDDDGVTMIPHDDRRAVIANHGRRPVVTDHHVAASLVASSGEGGVGAGREGQAC
jgi:hypothetical protein